MKGYMSFMEPSCCSFTADVSEEDFSRVVERMRVTIDLDRVIPYQRVDQMLIWHL
ncbi:MAG: hypothetical protein JRN21_05450 [Nitrososphaerota archaeon]|nr:hypothetical protein [Nitrososphaerota archaeon]